MKRDTILILITKLAEERRYSELIDVYDCYLDKIAEYYEAPILNEHLDIVIKALFIKVYITIFVYSFIFNIFLFAYK